MFALVLDRSTLSESWRDERILLQELEEADPVAVGPRLDEISGQPEGRTDGLFLQTGSLPLSLRENFAFWPGVECRLASQADVFTTVSAIMENLRSDEVEMSQRLVNDAQTHTVLEAETFSRYNDGVIQASFLRSALPIELDYRDSPMNSRLLRELLADMVDYRSRQQGEALGEFLLALACKRLKLTSSDWARLKEKFASTLTLETGIIGALGRYLARQPN